MKDCHQQPGLGIGEAKIAGNEWQQQVERGGGPMDAAVAQPE